MKSTRNLKPHHFTGPALFSLLALAFHPLPLWPEEYSPESVSFHLREKPVDVSSDQASPADFSPLDGNDWMENTDGTFTLKKSYLDEAAFKRSLEGMPYHDLDLYTMGLLDPNLVKSSFVIQNPQLEDGRNLRMHSSGNLIEIQNSDGTWSGPFYLPSGIKVKGTKKTISLSDITALEGKRDPAFPNTPKDFKVAFLTATNTYDEETSLDTLESTQKLQRFKDSFLRFFKEMARFLGTLSFPKGEAGSGGGGNGGGSGGGGGVFRATDPSAIAPTRQDFGGSPGKRGQVTQSFGTRNLSPFSDGDEPHPFEPVDFTQLRPVGFKESLEKILPESYSFEAVRNSLPPVSLSPVNLFGNLSFRGETLLLFLQELPSLTTGSLTLLPSVLTDSFRLRPSAFDLEPPLLYSDWKESQIQSLRDLWPEKWETLPHGFPDPDSSLPPSDDSTSPNPPPPFPSPPSTFGRPPSPSYTPWIWDALAPLRIRKDLEEKGRKKKPSVAQRLKQGTLHPSPGSKNNSTNVANTSNPLQLFVSFPPRLPTRVEGENSPKQQSESGISFPRSPPLN